MRQRSGTSLIEVLVAIFVMGIGMLTLLVLFPLGALSMAQAIKDDRCGHAAANAAATATIWGVRTDNGNSTGYWPMQYTMPAVLPNLNTVAGYNGPSYPVYVDPIGQFQNPGQGTVGATPPSYAGSPSPGFARVSTTQAGIPLKSSDVGTGIGFRWLALLDDLTFENNGVSALGSTGQIERDARYSWGYLCRMPLFSNTQIVNLSVVVYSGRPVIFNEITYAATFISNSPNPGDVITLSFPPTQEVPTIRPGMWVLDSTTINPATGNPDPHGYFYRVVNVGEPVTVGATTTVNLEIQTTLRSTNPGVVTIMDGVIEVFDVGTN